MKKSSIPIDPFPRNKLTQKNIPERGNNSAVPFWQEQLWLVLILIAGLLPRLIFIKVFPTHPISDFLSILNFSILFRDDWLAKNATQWRLFSPGLSFILSILLRFIPKSPETIGRWATAISTGLVPTIPYILWKGAFRLRTRICAALMLALWPGQILFSSVLAQDNWIIFPTVALSALAVRLWVMGEDGNPILAALLYAVAVAIREEMLLVLLPAAILGALGGRDGKRLRNFLIGSSIVGLLLAGLALQRGLATGRYTLTTGHLGASVLGAYMPGAKMNWVDPFPYAQAVHPELTESGVSQRKIDEVMLDLAWQEFLRQPRFQTIRIVGSALTYLFGVDTGITYWSLTADDVLPKGYRKSAVAFTNDLAPLLQIYSFLPQILFAFSLFFSMNQRQLLKWISPMLAPILLKVGLHAVIVSQARYFLVVIALELLTFAIVSEVCFKLQSRTILFNSLVLGILSVSAFYLISIKARDYVEAHDELPQLSYLFSLQTKAGNINCTMNQGHLIYVYGNEAKFELLDPDPRPRESAFALCTINPDQPDNFRLSVNDPYLPGGLPGRIEQIVYINGVETFRHDLAAESWAGWLEVPLGRVSPGNPLSFAVEMRAIAPDPDWKWGRATSTRFRVEVIEN